MTRLLLILSLLVSGCAGMPETLRIWDVPTNPFDPTQTLFVVPHPDCQVMRIYYEIDLDADTLQRGQRRVEMV